MFCDTLNKLTLTISGLQILLSFIVLSFKTNKIIFGQQTVVFQSIYSLYWGLVLEFVFFRLNYHKIKIFFVHTDTQNNGINSYFLCIYKTKKTEQEK